MKNVFIIQSALVDKHFGSAPCWGNLYCVSNELDARKDCIDFQVESNRRYLGNSFKFIYRYESLNLYD